MTSNTPHIEIYYAEICGLCQQALSYFRSRGLPFTAYEVFWDEAADAFVDSEHARTMYRRCGETIDFVPQIFIHGRHIRGWRELEPMIQSGEIEHVLRGPKK